MLSPFAFLPVELVRYILELAGCADHSSASQLVLVSHAVHSWILPILYQTLIIKDADQSQRLYRTLSRSPSLAGCAKNINIQVYEGDDSDDTLVSILQSCHNVSNLSTTLSLYRLFEAAASSYSVSHLRHDHYTSRLTTLHCASWDAWYYFSQHAYSYRNLTHLQIDTVYNSGLKDSWTSIVHYPTETIPNLTHLAFAFDFRSSPSEFSHFLIHVNRLLERQRLQFLVIMAFYCWEYDIKINNAMGYIKDPFRVRILTSPSYSDQKAYFEEWNAVVRGKSNLWDRSFKTGISVRI